MSSAQPTRPRQRPPPGRGSLQRVAGREARLAGVLGPDGAGPGRRLRGIALGRGRQRDGAVARSAAGALDVDARLGVLAEAGGRERVVELAAPVLVNPPIYGPRDRSVCPAPRRRARTIRLPPGNALGRRPPSQRRTARAKATTCTALAPARRSSRAAASAVAPVV